MGQLLAQMSSRELTEWQAFFSLEPFGELRDDLRSAIVAATVANSSRDPKRRPDPFEVGDFMPRFEEEPESERAERVWAKVNQTMAMFGGVMGSSATSVSGDDGLRAEE